MKRLLSMLCALALTLGMLPAASAASDTLTAGGWFESLYAQLPGFTDSQVTAVSYSGTMSGSLTGDDFTYLVRDVEDGVRVDIPGLKAGTYDLSVTAGGQTYTATGIRVMAYDRSGYAHWNYTEGVGAYNDDGTLKANAVVLYVTDENKETVSVTAKGVTVTGIGNILNSGGASDNGNNDILYKLAQEGKPLAVRFVGRVGKPAGVTVGGSTKYGGNTDDNGGMARMKNGRNITLEGIGHDATIDGWGFHFICEVKDYGRSFEARNMTFKNVPEDCLGMEGKGDKMETPVERCWVHNCAFYGPTGIEDFSEDQDKGQGDGACDFKRGQYYTMSYCYFEGYHKTNLVGASDTCQQYNITWHHVYWKKCEQRGPLGRQANMHIYNCLYEEQTSYCMSLRGNAYVFSEHNQFLKCANPVKLEKSSGSTEPVGACKSWGDVFTSCKGTNQAVIATSKTQAVSNTNKYPSFDTTSSQSYIPGGDYQLDDTATAEANIKAYAGPMKPADEVVAPGHTHAWGEWTETKAPTCTEAGEKTRTCTAADCPLGSQTQAVPALGHNYVNNVCTRCGAKLRGKTYTLTGDQVFALMEAGKGPGSFTLGANGYTGSYYTSAQANHKAGTEDFFTLRYASSSRVDPVAMTFSAPDAYSGQYRINFNGGVSKTQNAVQFTTGNIATVKVWWAPVTDKTLRPMVILDESGGEVAASATSDVPTVTTFTLADPGTYYLGGRGGKNFIYRVDVTIGGQKDPDAVDQGTMTGGGQSLNWKYTVDDQVVVTGELDGEEKILVGCYDGQNRLIGLKLLTRGELTAQMEPGIPTVKLFWLGEQQKPQCEAVTVNK